MTACNQCRDRMVPCDEAIVPVLKCVGCGRLIMLPGRFPRGRPAMVRELRKRGATNA